MRITPCSLLPEEKKFLDKQKKKYPVIRWCDVRADSSEKMEVCGGQMACGGRENYDCDVVAVRFV